MRYWFRLLCLFSFFVLVSCSEDNTFHSDDSDLQAEVITNLHDSATAVDYLVIAPQSLELAGRKLCSFHNKDTTNSLENAAVVTLGSIVELYGADTITAIHTFLKELPNKWAKDPKYIVLLGDARLADNQPGIPVPDTSYTGIYDNFYITPDTSSAHRYIVARIPVRSEEELDRYLTKVKTFRQNRTRSVAWIKDNNLLPSFPEWMRYNGYEYEIPDDFPSSNRTDRTRWSEIYFDQIAQGLMPILDNDGWNSTLFDMDHFTANYDSLLVGITEYDSLIVIGENRFFKDREKMREAFFPTVNKNHSLQIFLGHASPEIFTVEKLYSYEDAAQFTTPTIVLHLGCYSAEFTSDSSMTRTLMFQSEGGPVAFLGCPYVNYASNGTQAIRTILNDMVTDPSLTIGELFEEYSKDNSTRKRFILLGDPLLRVY